MVHAVNIQAILNTLRLISVNKQTLHISDHHLCFCVTSCVQYWTLYWILPFPFHINLCFPYYTLCSVLPFVLHVRVSYYAYCIRLDKKLPQMKRPENFFKESVLIKWSKYLENFCLWWRAENSKCPFPTVLCRSLTVCPSVAGCSVGWPVDIWAQGEGAPRLWCV